MTRAAAALLAAAAALAAACGGRTLEAWVEHPGPYDRLTAEQREGLRRARALVEAGELENARRLLAGLADESPRNLVIATLRQDVELALLAEGLYVPGLVLGEHASAPRERLLGLYERRAGDDADAATRVLLARLADDPEEALALLEDALALDPGCVWAHYGRAATLARLARHREAEEALARAVELDPGHPPTRRLEAALLARAGEVELAIEAHRRWIAGVEGDPRVAPESLAAARVDLASLYVQRGEPDEALAALEGVDPGALARPGDAELVRAAALEMLGRPRDALAAAERAAALAPGDALPLAQRALLLGEHLADPGGERASWRELLGLLDARGPEAAPAGGGDPAAREVAELLLRLQARARLARLAAAEADGADAGDAAHAEAGAP